MQKIETTTRHIITAMIATAGILTGHTVAMIAAGIILNIIIKGEQGAARK